MRVILAALSFLTCNACASSPPPSGGIYPDEVVHPLPDDLSQFKQPQSLIEDLQRIQTGSLEERIQALADKSKRDQVFVEGGTFMMGDFGRIQSEEGLPWDGNSNSSPLHEVTLDSYSISKYKVTLAEFDLYAEVNQVPSVQTEQALVDGVAGLPPWRTPDKPAGVTWHQADAYCQWVGKITGLPFALPTEAQWEYAARDRGRFVVYPTDNGKLEWNRNVPTRGLIKALNDHSIGGGTFSIALFPPNPLGIYDLTINSLDWMQDWYSEDWYARPGEKLNPSGPSDGENKSQRSWPSSNSRAAMTITRRHGKPGLQTSPGGEPGPTSLDGFRCTLQSR